MPTPLAPEQLARDLSVRDLTDPAAGRHALQLLIDDAVAALAAAWPCDVRVERGPRVVAVADNYDRLGYAADAVAREARYTRYVDSSHVLRSHTSATVPPALTRLAAEPADDVLLVCAGITYRRDAIDRFHTATPHQLDLWRITRRPMAPRDLDEMIAVLADALLPGRACRTEPRVHPYTVDGRQVDIRAGDEWVEVWECGRAHPTVLRRCGLGGWSGLALGMGLDRVLMVRKGIPDIRLLRSGDWRVASQMQDLDPYRPVSNLPATIRDVSVAVAADADVERLGDLVRDALGDDAAVIEAVEILAEAAYADVPEPARQRLGMTPLQKNVLLRLTVRPLDRTLTSVEANMIRDRVYAALHQGAVGQWAAR